VIGQGRIDYLTQNHPPPPPFADAPPSRVKSNTVREGKCCYVSDIVKSRNPFWMKSLAYLEERTKGGILNGQLIERHKHRVPDKRY